MHRLLEIAELKSGERAEIWKITAPDHAWRERLLSFLAHKGEPWLKPMSHALSTGIEGLTMNFYECVLGDQIIANVTVVESLQPPVGLLQHVYTTPEHRRKGAASALLGALLKDFRLRGGQAMHLNTGYQSPPFWIYHTFGFRPIAETGHMRWLGRPDFMQAFFAPGETCVEDMAWKHWPLLDILYGVEEGWVLRDLRHGLYGPTGFEGPLVSIMWDKARKEITQARVLVSRSTGAVVGFAYTYRQRQYPSQPHMLEFFV
ncbi:MAG: GNAT family N-acetyltransferase, partial [Armatimonadetes bacterium]|nr:GNAT family N-acetyltransferase [Armatimonadota bacterium]